VAGGEVGVGLGLTVGGVEATAVGREAGVDGAIVVGSLVGCVAAVGVGVGLTVGLPVGCVVGVGAAVGSTTGWVGEELAADVASAFSSVCGSAGAVAAEVSGAKSSELGSIEGVGLSGAVAVALAVGIGLPKDWLWLRSVFGDCCGRVRPWAFGDSFCSHAESDMVSNTAEAPASQRIFEFGTRVPPLIARFDS